MYGHSSSLNSDNETLEIVPKRITRMYVIVYDQLNEPGKEVFQ